jgi:hypothetical protein
MACNIEQTERICPCEKSWCTKCPCNIETCTCMCPYIPNEICPDRIKCIRCFKIICVHSSEAVTCVPKYCWTCGKQMKATNNHELFSEGRIVDGRQKGWCNTQCYDAYKQFISQKENEALHAKDLLYSS